MHLRPDSYCTFLISCVFVDHHYLSSIRSTKARSPGSRQVPPSTSYVHLPIPIFRYTEAQRPRRWLQDQRAKLRCLNVKTKSHYLRLILRCFFPSLFVACFPSPPSSRPYLVLMYLIRRHAIKVQARTSHGTYQRICQGGIGTRKMAPLPCQPWPAACLHRAGQI